MTHTKSQVWDFCAQKLVQGSGVTIEVGSKSFHSSNETVFYAFGEDLQEKIEMPDILQKGKRKYWLYLEMLCHKAIRKFVSWYAYLALVR